MPTALSTPSILLEMLYARGIILDMPSPSILNPIIDEITELNKKITISPTIQKIVNINRRLKRMKSDE